MQFQTLSPDKRSLDEIAAAAEKEKGPLIVAAGGDGMLLPTQPFMPARLTNGEQLKRNGTSYEQHSPNAFQSSSSISQWTTRNIMIRELIELYKRDFPLPMI